MSRIGKQIIAIPEGVEVSINDGSFTVKGPKGVLEQDLHHAVSLKIEDQKVTVHVKDETDKAQKALWGLYASLVKNMITGVVSGVERKLEINGVGYKWSVSGNKVILNVGYSHPVDFILPEGIVAVAEGNLLTLTGINKQLVGQVAADIRKVRKPEPYKGKGIKYIEEEIIRKVGKAASK